MMQVPVRDAITPEQFHSEIRRAGLPVIIKGMVAGWPLVTAARQGDRQLAATLARHAAAVSLSVAIAPAEAHGCFHYVDDVSRLNFERTEMGFAEMLALLLREAEQPVPRSIAGQGLNAARLLPGFEKAHPMPLLPPSVPPRMWIGNAAKVATHNDELENIACVVAGRRRFTLFPPDQIGNLYMGPFELTPGGTPISMVHVSAPDLERYPRYAKAQENGWVADLEPGDALYIPYQWFHHVEARDRLNILINYWWNDARPDLGYAWDALLHAMIALGPMPQDQRRAWRATFDHYVFDASAETAAHLPESARGVLAATSPAEIERLKQDLIRNLLAQTPERFGPMK